MSNKNMLNVYNPYSNELIAELKTTTKKQVEKHIIDAVLGQKTWSDLPLSSRANVLYKFLTLVEDEKDKLSSLLSQESGKPIKEAQAEINNIAIGFLAFIEKAKHLYDTSFPGTSEAGQASNLQITTREPLGVVACILPFNFPCDLFCQKVAPALMMGNSVIVLPSTNNPLTVRELVKLLKKAGVPEDAIHCLIGEGRDIGPVLTQHPDVNMVTFTGSTPVGLEISDICASRLAHVALELGGNDAFIVCEDADIDLAVKEMIWGRMYNSGQVCCASKRFIIHKAKVDTFIEKSIAQLQQLNLGSPQDESTDFGCLISEQAAVSVERQVALTIEQGGKLVFGGTREGACYSPTIITDIPVTADVASNMEIFGPVVSIIPFETEEEAIRIANASIYALSACVFSTDYKKAIAYSKQIECGVFVVNGASFYRSFEIPFCGHKMSGFGSEGVSSTLEEMSKVKSLILKDVY
ncbi:hypothetical protein H334_21930 [Vibrio parahaemolyticus 901128]|nr:aldehyde dehydrogenase [Vibrio parahaemolyticus]KIT54377.1 hypothetical protein H334_21930 [Vibrio parahaemolyticus 901128]